MVAQNYCVVRPTRTPPASVFFVRLRTYTYKHHRYSPYSSWSFLREYPCRCSYVLKQGIRSWQYYAEVYHLPGHFHRWHRPIYDADSSNDPLHALHTHRFNLVVGLVGLMPPSEFFFIASFSPQLFLLVLFLITWSSTKRTFTSPDFTLL